MGQLTKDYYKLFETIHTNYSYYRGRYGSYGGIAVEIHDYGLKVNQFELIGLTLL